jgi:prevent-host-death family protein
MTMGGQIHMKQATLTDLTTHLDELLQDARHEGILITRAGKPAGVLMGFASEDECYDYLLKHDPTLLQTIAEQPEPQN